MEDGSEARYGRWPAVRVSVLAIVAVLVGAQPAVAGFSGPQLHVSLTGPAGPIPKGDTATYEVTVSNTGTEPAPPSSELNLSSFRVNGEKPVDNPYRSVESSLGIPCTIDQFQSSFGTYHGATCSMAGLPAGGTARVTAVVEINESQDESAYVHEGGGAGDDSARMTTYVDAPPVVSGSKAIKVSGLPNGCVKEGFRIKVQANGAKKITAALRGPLNSEGKVPADVFSSFNEKFAAEKGSKLQAVVDADHRKLEPGLYAEVGLTAKYESKPKQKASVLFQRCP